MNLVDALRFTFLAHRKNQMNVPLGSLFRVKGGSLLKFRRWELPDIFWGQKKVNCISRLPLLNIKILPLDWVTKYLCLFAICFDEEGG